MLFLLIVKDEFDGGYDSYDAKVVSAASEEDARELANQKTGEEGKIWQDSSKVTCERLTDESCEGIVCASFNAG